MRGDGETESMTQGRCDSCGASLDQAASCGCQAGAIAPAPTTETTGPDVIAAAVPAPAPAAPSMEPQQPIKSEAALRFGWDPAMPDEPAPSALEPSGDEPRKTISETALPAPELEALFAALEASPIRIKPSTPEPVQPVQHVAPEPPPVEAPSPIAFEAPRAFDPPAPAAAEVSATINLQAAISAAAFEPLRDVAPQAMVEAAAPAPVAPAPDVIPDVIPNAGSSVIPSVIPSVHEEETAFTPIKIRMPVFDALPPVTPAPLVDVVSAEPRAAAPAPIVAAVTAPPPAKTVEEAPVVAAAIETPKVATPPPAPKPAPAPAPAPAARVEATPAAKPANRRSLVTAAAAVVILGAIGVPLSRLWLGRASAQPAVQQLPVQQPAAPRPAPPAHTATPAAAPSTAPTPASTPVPVAAAPATPPPAAAVRPNPAPPAVTPAPTAVAQKPRPEVPDAARVAPKPTRPATAPAPQAAPALTTLSPTIVMPGSTELPAAPAEPAPAPLPAEPAAAPASGPFFELNDVDRPPRVATRIPAAIPSSLQGQALNEIVVVRVLVSQTGRPALVSLLRHSKAGLELDEAVITAVKQWTFTPAVKRGQNVSCFYHVGVPVAPR